jgi:hypothetical protein
MASRLVTKNENITPAIGVLIFFDAIPPGEKVGPLLRRAGKLDRITLTGSMGITRGMLSIWA